MFERIDAIVLRVLKEAILQDRKVRAAQGIQDLDGNLSLSAAEGRVKNVFGRPAFFKIEQN